MNLNDLQMKVERWLSQDARVEIDMNSGEIIIRTDMTVNCDGELTDYHNDDTSSYGHHDREDFHADEAVGPVYFREDGPFDD